MKVVENNPQNARNCTFFKNFLGGHAPKPPYQRLAASLLATCRFAACISKIPEILKLGPPLRNPAYAPVNHILYLYLFNKLTSLLFIMIDSVRPINSIHD